MLIASELYPLSLLWRRQFVITCLLAAVPVEQLNQLTAYVDASQVYGSSAEEQKNLRTFKGGKFDTMWRRQEINIIIYNIPPFIPLYLLSKLSFLFVSVTPQIKNLRV